MINCVYTKALSEVSYDDDAKRKLFQNIYAAMQPAQKEANAVCQKRKAWIGVASAACAVALVLALALGIFGITSQGIDVVNPISREDGLTMKSKAENAQYLPNLQLLGNKDSYGSKSNIALTSYGDNTKSADDFYNQYDVYVDDYELDFGTDDYREINDALGLIDSSLGKMTAEDIKAEVSYIFDVIPGYDQWFRLVLGASSPDNRVYSDCLYRVSYDKEKDIVCMTRVANHTSTSVYDGDARKFYATSLGDGCYESEILSVTFTRDDENREIVECVNTRYFVLDGSYYPVNRQYLSNVKDTSATKLDVYFTVKNDVCEGYADVIGDIANAYALNDISADGIFVKGIRLDYADNDDVELFKFDKWYPSEYSSAPVTTNIAYYGKKSDDRVFYVDSWDYYDEEASQGYIEFDNEYSFSGYATETDGKWYIRAGAVKEIFTTDISVGCQKGYCMYCEKEGYPYSDFLLSCGHIVSSDAITRHDKWCIYNTSNATFDESVIRKNIVSLLSKTCDGIKTGAGEFGNYDESDIYAFEYAFDEYTSRLVHSYLDGHFDFQDISDTAAKAEKEGAVLTEDKFRKN